MNAPKTTAGLGTVSVFTADARTWGMVSGAWGIDAASSAAANVSEIMECLDRVPD